jgi:hypothetical protein
MYLLMESDLHPLSVQNLIFKFADDTNLLVPQHSDLSMVDEFKMCRTGRRKIKWLSITQKLKR